MEGARAGITSAAVVAASAIVLCSKRVHDLDRSASAAIARPLGPGVDRAAGALTDLGSVFALAGAAAVLAVGGRRRAARDLVGAGMTGWVAAQALKPVAGRPRPYEADDAVRLVSEPAGASWPSGHPAVVAATVAALGPSLPPTARRAGAAVTVGVAVSRVYVGVHYLGDVVAGVALGHLAGRLWRLVAALAGLRRGRLS